MNDEPIWMRLREIADRLERGETAGDNIALVCFRQPYPENGSSAILIDGDMAVMTHKEWLHDAIIVMREKLRDIK